MTVQSRIAAIVALVVVVGGLVWMGGVFNKQTTDVAQLDDEMSGIFDSHIEDEMSEQKPSRALSAGAKRQSILMIDNSPTTQQLFADSLADRYDVRTAGNKVDMYQRLSEAKPDVIFLDIHMPDGDVYLVGELKRNPLYANIPIVVVITDAGRDELYTAKNEGAVGWITKPFRIDYVYSILERLSNR